MIEFLDLDNELVLINPKYIIAVVPHNSIVCRIQGTRGAEWLVRGSVESVRDKLEGLRIFNK
jgi:hypothetical protein